MKSDKSASELRTPDHDPEGGYAPLSAWRDVELCACGADLETPYERRIDKCYECERLDERMLCMTCGVYVGMAYTDGRPTVCSDQCEKAYWDA